MMSSDKIADQKITLGMPRLDGKIQHGDVPCVTFRLFGAYQFSRKHNRHKKNFSPPVPVLHEAKQEYYQKMYRLSIDRVWYSPEDKKYQLFRLDQITAIITSWAARI